MANTRDQTIPIAFDMHPIGMNHALEAIGAFGFCSAECRTAFVQSHPDLALHQADEPGDVFADDHTCDYCGKNVF